jgi:hypothetical protein
VKVKPGKPEGTESEEERAELLALIVDVRPSGASPALRSSLFARSPHPFDTEQMRIGELGLREWVALAVVAGVLVIGASFYFAFDSSNGSPAPRPAPTPQVVQPTAPWQLTWTAVTPGGDEAVVKQEAAPAVDFKFDRAPFPEVNDDGWRVSASTVFAGPAGAYALSISYRGEIGVSIGGADQKITPAIGEASFDIAFDLAEGESKRLFVRLRDAAGEARLSARIVKRVAPEQP